MNHTLEARRRAAIQQWWRWRCTPESGWPGREESLEIMRRCGVPTIPSARLGSRGERPSTQDIQTQNIQAGLPREAGNWTPDWNGELVAHTQDQGHAASTQRRLGAGEQPTELAGCLVMPMLTPGVSLRWLAIGQRRFALIYRSDDSWMSNAGDEGDILSVMALPTPDWDGGLNLRMGPIWAVDFVAIPGHDWLILHASGGGLQSAINWQGLVACDLNPAPGIQGTGLHQTLGGSVVQALMDSGFTPRASEPGFDLLSIQGAE